MEQRSTQRRRFRDFDFTAVKENVVVFLLTSFAMGAVGFVIGTWKRVDDLDVSYREVFRELDKRLDSHEFRLKVVEDFNDTGPRFTLEDGEKLRRECSLLANDLKHWTVRIVRNEQGLEELEAECRNLNTIAQ